MDHILLNMKKAQSIGYSCHNFIYFWLLEAPDFIGETSIITVFSDDDEGGFLVVVEKLSGPKNVIVLH